MRCKWFYRVNTGDDGSIQRYKARLVTQGFSQKYGIDFDQTFCPVVRQECLRYLIATSVQQELILEQVDVTTAFLNGVLEDEVHMYQPGGYIVPGKEEFVCKLNKSIYGLKQSLQCWNNALDTHLKNIGFVQADSDLCIYYKTTGNTCFMLVSTWMILFWLEKVNNEFKKSKMYCQRNLKSKILESMFKTA